jgi:hypothetical protein
MKHFQSICPCQPCQDDRNYRSLHTDHPLTEQELKHSRRIARREGIKKFFLRIMGDD